MKFKINILSQRLFILFLVVAAAMWYVNKLGYNYRSEIRIPVNLTVDNNSIGWVENTRIEVNCLVDAKGSDILLYKLGLASPTEVSITALTLTNAPHTKDDYLYRISDASMKDALDISQASLQIFQILDTIPWVKVSPMDDASIPIKSNIVINCEKQYMVVGQVKIQPSTINVRAAWTVLDTLKYIETEPIVLDDQHKSISGSVGLIMPKGVTASEKQVRYSADITGYTELEYTMPVELRNNPDSVSVVCVPSQVAVIVRVPLRSFTTDEIATPRAFIDYADRLKLRGNQFKVYVEDLPVGGSVAAVIPNFVEPFFKTN